MWFVNHYTSKTVCNKSLAILSGKYVIVLLSVVLFEHFFYTSNEQQLCFSLNNARANITIVTANIVLLQISFEFCSMTFGTPILLHPL